MMTAPAFQQMIRMFVSSNSFAFCLLVISSNLGCRHVPGEGVEIPLGSFGSKGVDRFGVFFGVEIADCDAKGLWTREDAMRLDMDQMSTEDR